MTSMVADVALTAMPALDVPGPFPAPAAILARPAFRPVPAPIPLSPMAIRAFRATLRAVRVVLRAVARSLAAPADGPIPYGLVGAGAHTVERPPGRNSTDFGSGSTFDSSVLTGVGGVDAVFGAEVGADAAIRYHRARRSIHPYDQYRHRHSYQYQ